MYIILLAGFEVVIRNHFRITRQTLLRLCCDWLKECPDVHDERKMRRVIDEVRVELDKLGEDLEVEEEEQEESEEED